MEKLIDDILSELPKASVYKEIWNGKALSLIGTITTASRLILVSHEYPGTITYVDREKINGVECAEWIGKKLIAVLRRTDQAQMRLLGKTSDNKALGGWCSVPDELCGFCPCCKRYGSLSPGKGMSWSRIRIGDLYSVQPARVCIATHKDIPEYEMEGAVGNTVSERSDRQAGRRDSASYYHYEYIREGTMFPFVLVVLDPDQMDFVSISSALKAADSIGYGKYAARFGKTQTSITHMVKGLPKVTPLELTLRIREQPNYLQTATDLGFGETVKISDPEAFFTLVYDRLKAMYASFDFDVYLKKTEKPSKEQKQLKLD